MLSKVVPLELCIQDPAVTDTELHKSQDLMNQNFHLQSFFRSIGNYQGWLDCGFCQLLLLISNKPFYHIFGISNTFYIEQQFNTEIFHAENNAKHSSIQVLHLGCILLDLSRASLRYRPSLKKMKWKVIKDDSWNLLTTFNVPEYDRGSIFCNHLYFFFLFLICATNMFYGFQQHLDIIL